jgi:hypothetical protein
MIRLLLVLVFVCSLLFLLYKTCIAIGVQKNGVFVLDSCHRELGLQSPGIVHSFDEGFDGVLNGNYDYFYSLAGQVAWAANGKYCGKLALVGDSFFQNSVGFLLPRNSALTNEMSRGILQLREMDKIPSSTEYALRSKKCPPIMNPTLVRLFRSKFLSSPVAYLCSCSAVSRMYVYLVS